MRRLLVITLLMGLFNPSLLLASDCCDVLQSNKLNTQITPSAAHTPMPCHEQDVTETANTEHNDSHGCECPMATASIGVNIGLPTLPSLAANPGIELTTGLSLRHHSPPFRPPINC